MVRVTEYEKEEWFEMALLGGYPSVAAWLRDCIHEWQVRHLGTLAEPARLDVHPEALRAGREDFTLD